MPLGNWINDGLDWAVTNFRPFFQTIRAPIDSTLSGVEALLTSIPALAMVAVIGLLAWQFAGRLVAVGAVLSLLLVAMLGVWPEAMVTLSLVLTSLVFCIVIGLPLGIALASSDTAQRALRPVLDAMQTTPAFVYLVPVVMLFGIGNVPGVIVTIVFALPPVVRLTNLGVRQVRPDLIEAARAFGASPMQMLFKVQLPLAMPSVMAGINQTLMLSLSMVVIASMIAVGGFGQMVLRGIGRLDMGLATIGGLGVVLLAITLDRITQAMGQSGRGARHWWQTGPTGWLIRLAPHKAPATGTSPRTASPSASQHRNFPRCHACFPHPWPPGLTCRLSLPYPTRTIPMPTNWFKPHPILAATALAVGLLGTSSAALAADMPGKGIEVQPLKSSIAEETFQTLLVMKALEQLGYDVKPIKEIEYATAHLAIGNGDATFLADHWNPMHADFYKNAGGDDKLVRKGVYSDNAAQGYLIDKKTADKYKIINISQFADPKIAKLFDTDGDGKADLTGCTPGWGCEAVIEHHLKAYKLGDSVTHQQGSYSALIADTITRFKAGEPVFYYTWTPYWASAQLKLGKEAVWLEVPFSSLPGEQSKLDTTLPNGKNYGFVVNKQQIVANKAFIEKNPAAGKLFEVMELPINDINAQNNRMAAGEKSAADIDRHTSGWIKAHQKTFDGWLAHARAAEK